MTQVRYNLSSAETLFERRTAFFVVFFAVVFFSYAFLYAIDFIPEAPKTSASTLETHGTSANTPETSDTSANTPEIPALVPDANMHNEQSDVPTVSQPHVTEGITPDFIIIDKLDKKIAVLNPTSDSIEVLDNALLSGVVRHPDSAMLNEDGTIFLFGHSSYLPKVINKNFQAFNGIQKLTWGDKIRIQASNTEYVYRVDRVYQVKASVAEIKIESGKAKLTLVTCNTFGSKDDRYIVESMLIDSYPIKS